MSTHESYLVGRALPKPLHIAASPRSSVSAETSQSPRTPASPFLHNLHHRFRKGSNASSSMSSDAAGPNAAPAVSDPSERAEAAQSAKRFLLSIVRNDWEYPATLPHLHETQENLKKDEILAAREPMSWQTRHEAQSDIDFDSDGSVNGYARKKRKGGDPYKFENPDAIAVSITEKKLKRRKRTEAEMEWNEGLSLWNVRRDAWTGAVGNGVPNASPMESYNGRNGVNGRQPTDHILTDGHAQDLQHTSDSMAPMVENSLTASGNPASSTPVSAVVTAQPTTQSPVKPASSPSVPLPDPSLDGDALDGPYLPIFPPLFPTSHTLRSRIKPAAYPTIYSKVVVQSLTPNVPIPLTHMIGALVDGWKSEGNWPPQNAAEQQAQLSRKNIRKSETAFGRWRREQEEKKRLTKRHGETGDAALEEFDEHGKKGFRRSLTGAVKKVLGMHGEDDDADGGLGRLGITFSENEDNMDDSLLIEDTRPETETYIHNQP